MSYKYRINYVKKVPYAVPVTEFSYKIGYVNRVTGVFHKLSYFGVFVAQLPRSEIMRYLAEDRNVDVEDVYMPPWFNKEYY